MRCHNRVCEKQIKPVASSDGKKAWRRTHRKFCSDPCKQDFSALGRVAVMVLVSGQKKVWEALSGISGGKYIPPLEAWNGQRDYSARRQKLRDSTMLVDQPAPIPLDQLVQIIKVWNRLKRWKLYKGLKKGNSQVRAGAEIVSPGAN